VDKALLACPDLGERRRFPEGGGKLPSAKRN